VKYEIFISPKTLDLADQGDNKFHVEVIAVASTPKNPWVNQVTEVLGGNLPPEAIAAIHQQGISYNNALKLPPGESLIISGLKMGGEVKVSTAYASWFAMWRRMYFGG
jgi:hypothetical protein